MAQLWGFSRTFISFPAGAMHMNIYLFVIYTFLGGSIFSLLAILASIALTRTMRYTIMALRGSGWTFSMAYNNSCPAIAARYLLLFLLPERYCSIVFCKKYVEQKPGQII
jgi:membrane protein DedA with SNARE-associated domain